MIYYINWILGFHISWHANITIQARHFEEKGILEENYGIKPRFYKNVSRTEVFPMLQQFKLL